MKKDTEKKKILARDKAISVGIDVHKRSRHLTAVSDGLVLFKGTSAIKFWRKVYGQAPNFLSGI